METTMRRQNPDTPARWEAATRRAITQGVIVRQLGCGVWVATSGTDSATAYVVTTHECECRAGAEGDPVCKHRAALRQHVGMIASAPAPDTTPYSVVAEALAIIEDMEADMLANTIATEPPAKCPDCLGRGWKEVYRSGRLNDWTPGTCNTCRGAKVAA